MTRILHVQIINEKCITTHIYTSSYNFFYDHHTIFIHTDRVFYHNNSKLRLKLRFQDPSLSPLKYIISTLQYNIHAVYIQRHSMSCMTELQSQSYVYTSLSTSIMYGDTSTDRQYHITLSLIFLWNGLISQLLGIKICLKSCFNHWISIKIGKNIK
jgi:hypothetical protein